MNSIDISPDFLNMVMHAAEDAGEKILEVYNSDSFDITQKEDQSPLTRADTAAHHSIILSLKAISSLPVLSEESESIPFDERRKWSTYWLVDPLDGTKEFIKRNDEFTVNIALIENHIPVLGVVAAPAKKLSYKAAKGLGAFKSVNGRNWESIQTEDYRNQKFRIVASRSHGSDRLTAFLEKIKDYEILSSGSSLKLCMVADGRAHLYARLGPTMEWDTAAAHAVVLEAGGHVVDLNNQELRYNKENLLNPEFIVTGTPPFPWKNYL